MLWIGRATYECAMMDEFGEGVLFMTDFGL